MELPHIGKHCSEPTCNKLDFLPVKCDACSKIFCHEHMTYLSHQCPEAKSRDFQVPVCPLCSKPVPSRRGEPPDVAVGEHIDRDCLSDPAKTRRKVFSNKCGMKGCRKKELVPFLCSICHRNYCISHRHSVDHNCVQNENRDKNTISSRKAPDYRGYIQGNMDEDEAFAHAIALSLTETEKKRHVENNITPLPRTRTLVDSERNSNHSCHIS